MQFTDFSSLQLSRLPTPCFVVDEVAVERNLRILKQVGDRSGAVVLQALKAFSMHSLADLSMRYLAGTCSSGLYEARLAREFYPGEIHVFSPAYSESDLKELLGFANHIVFNTPSQLERFSGLCRDSLATRADLSIGLRINPEHSEGTVPLYDPCVAGSRLGTTLDELEAFLQKSSGKRAFEMVSGLHFHTLCEQKFPPLERTLRQVEKKFAKYLDRMEWLNVGGGHHITSPGYEADDLVACLQQFRQTRQLKVYLEPGEAVAIGTGVLVAEVMETGFNQLNQAILNTSATCHMPDTLEMPYRADVMGAAMPGVKPHAYRLGGMTCLAGDIMGDYSFDRELRVGDRLVFEDMAHYTMVKTSTFNGTPLPAIVIWNSTTDEIRIVRQFGYEDFKTRLS